MNKNKTKQGISVASVDTSIDSKPADREWLRLWGNVRDVFNAVVQAENPKDKWKGKNRYRRLLNSMSEVRRGETKFGPVTQYSPEWAQAKRLKDEAADLPPAKTLFNAGAQAELQEVADNGRLLSAPVDEPRMWVSYRNYLPFMDSERPAHASLH